MALLSVTVILYDCGFLKGRKLIVFFTTNGTVKHAKCVIKVRLEWNVR